MVERENGFWGVCPRNSRQTLREKEIEIEDTEFWLEVFIENGRNFGGHDGVRHSPFSIFFF